MNHDAKRQFIFRKSSPKGEAPPVGEWQKSIIFNDKTSP